jgi:glycosyltransferase involved in cell wall biosynthesis
MREGVPVVVPEFALEIRRIVNETKAGILVDVTDPSDIAGAVLRLLNDPALAATMGRDGRIAIEGNYNWAADERRLLEVFERVAPR